MQPDVPPDFFRVVDATGFDQQLAVVVVLRKRFEGIGNASARKTFEHFEAITFQPRIMAHPERRVDRESVDVRQKIARLIHHVDGALAIGHSDMNVQPKDQVCPGEQLHVFDDLLVTFALSDVLVPPVRKRMRAD